MPRVRDLLELIDRLAPWRLAAQWDNVGLMVGRKDAPADRIALALDPTRAMIRAAHDRGDQVLLAHHPLIFKSLKSLDLDDETGAAAALAVKLDLSVVAAHTNLDAAPRGVAMTLGRRLGMTDLEVLDPFGQTMDDGGAPVGFGCVGNWDPPLSFGELIRKLKDQLNLERLRVASPGGGPFRRPALLPGSGGSYAAAAMAAGAEVLITGDVGHHQAREAEHLGLCLVDAGHFATERPVLDALARDLADLAASRSLDMVFHVLDGQTGPWSIW